MESKPEYEPIVTERLAKLHELWEKLESTTQEKARLLFDANRSELFDQSLSDMKKWLAELQQQLQGGDEDVKDLTNANILLKKHQVCSLCCAFSNLCPCWIRAAWRDTFLNSQIYLKLESSCSCKNWLHVTSPWRTATCCGL